MGLFWKSVGVRRKRTEPDGAATDVDQVAQRIAFRLLRFQRNFSDRVNLYVRKLKLPVLLAVLVSLGSAFGIYCLYLVLSAFF